jgi:DNA adenine methylase
MRERITFIQGDAFEYMERLVDDVDAFFFIDPPYTIAGRRLYNH